MASNVAREILAQTLLIAQETKITRKPSGFGSSIDKAIDGSVDYMQLARDLRAGRSVQIPDWIAVAAIEAVIEGDTAQLREQAREAERMAVLRATPYERMRFSKIETSGTLPDGRVIRSINSYPMGVGYDVYSRINEAMVRSYGARSCRIVGTPIVEMEG